MDAKTIDRVPHPSDMVTYDPPITLTELMVRLHRPGLGDARCKYELRVSTDVKTRHDLDPEKGAAIWPDVQVKATGDVIETNLPAGEYHHRHIARILLNPEQHVTSLQADSSAPFYNATRFLLLASTPLVES